jgi:hypothetical protein
MIKEKELSKSAQLFPERAFWPTAGLEIGALVNIALKRGFR